MDTPAPSLPRDAEHLLRELDHDLTYLHMVWKVYRQLFGTDASRVETLNEVAPATTHVLHDALQDVVYLGLTRLTDPSQTGKHDNLTFSRLVEMVDRPEYLSLHAQLAAALHKARDLCQPFRDYRNKRIAHNGLAESLRSTYTRQSRAGVEAALLALREFMNLTNTWLALGPTAYEHVMFAGGGDSLVYWLREGLRLEDIRRRALDAGLGDAQLRAEIQRRSEVTNGPFDR